MIPDRVGGPGVRTERNRNGTTAMLQQDAFLWCSPFKTWRHVNVYDPLGVGGGAGGLAARASGGSGRCWTWRCGRACWRWRARRVTGSVIHGRYGMRQPRSRRQYQMTSHRLAPSSMLPTPMRTGRRHMYVLCFVHAPRGGEKFDTAGQRRLLSHQFGGFRDEPGTIPGRDTLRPVSPIATWSAIFHRCDEGPCGDGTETAQPLSSTAAQAALRQ
ncbi:hypothetical protein VTO42DRAFT_7070 [Malbranchea cinnamomea]